VFVQPIPHTYRANPTTIDRLFREMKGRPELDEGLVERLCEQWAAKPEAPVPDTLEDWVLLAETSRESRSMRGPFGRVYVAGRLFLTRLELDLTYTQKVWDFDDSEENMRRMVSESDHPLSQLGPCPCGSGETFLACHLAKVPDDQPCLCGQDKPFVKCCRLDAHQDVDERRGATAG